MINYHSLNEALSARVTYNPFAHCVIDNFFDDVTASILSEEFPNFDSDKWHVYNNELEVKKTLNNWNEFPITTYSAFGQLYSKKFIDYLNKYFNTDLIFDPGLHGGGWHIHGVGGNLNPHLDYSIHPKLQLQRKLNIIIYLSKELCPKDHGGHLGLWSNDPLLNQPDKLVVEIEPLFNRAVIFDTTQMSWHGMSQILRQPEGIFRKSLAAYYLCVPDPNASKVQRALFAPRDSQKNDDSIAALIKLRASVDTSSLVYKKK